MRTSVGCLWLVGIAVIGAATAQDYPTKPIKLVAPFMAGSTQDLRARHIGNLLGPRLGQPIIIDNRPGANGAIGSALVARSRPDGYTLLLCTSATLSANAALMPDLPYDPVRDFAPVVRLVTTSGVVAVATNSPFRTLRDLVAGAKLKPRTLRYGAGSAYSHILGELVSRRAGVRLVRVPYKGDAQALTDLLGGHIDLVFFTPIQLVPHAKAGRLRALAVAGAHRLRGLPDIPTIDEQGVPSSEFPAWAGLCAPAGTPSSVIGKLNREALTVMLSPEVKVEMESQGYDVPFNSATEFAAFLRADIARTAALVKDLGIRLDN